MKITINEKLITRGRRIATVMTIVGMGLLIGSIFVAQTPERMNGALLMSIGGFIITVIASFYTKRWVRRPRTDQVIDKALKGLGHKYHIYHYIVPKVDHVLLGPQGLFVLNAQPADGEISYQQGKWRRKFHWTHLLRGFGDDAVGDPARDMAKEVRTLQEFVTAQAPDLEVQAQGVVVFTSDRLQLDVADAPLPAVRAERLKGLLRKDKKKVLDSNTQQKLAELFAAQVK